MGAELIRRCCGDLDGISAVRSRGDQLLRMPKKEMAESVDCAVSFSFTMQVDPEHKHIPSRKPQKDLQPTDLDEKLTALRRRTAG